LESALAALLPQPLVVSARESQSEASAGSPGPHPPEAIQAAAIPSTGGTHPGLLIAFGGLLLGASLFLLLVVFRRHRPAPQGSLITQSMNQR
jgi:LPXTG-motif cell wall-anchored protein